MHSVTAGRQRLLANGLLHLTEAVEMTLSRMIGGAATVITMAVGAPQALAVNDLQYDVQDQRNEETFKQLLWETRSCMNEGARGALIQGSRDSAAIVNFVQNACGGSLLTFMTTTLKRPNGEVVAFIQALAYNEINRIPGLTRSGSSQDPVKRPERSATYIISTLNNGQPIGTRNVEASEFRNAAIALINAFQDKTPSYQQTENAAKNMTAKDRCFNLYSSKIALASIEAGKLDASPYAESFLKNSIATIEAVNKQTKVACEMR